MSLDRQISIDQSQTHIFPKFHAASLSLKSPAFPPLCNKYTNNQTDHSVADTGSSKAANYLVFRIAPHPSRPQCYLFTICQGDRTWSYPRAWTKEELKALKMVAKNSIYSLNLLLPPSGGPPREVGKLYQLIEGRLYPSVYRVAAEAQRRAEEVAA